jgi:hypothetical protein
MYAGEVGHGLGPTLEFFNLFAKAMQEIKFDIGLAKKPVTLWHDDVPHQGLFPRGIDAKNTDRETLNGICKLFQVTGALVAKSILDNRLLDMPFSPLMWDLIFGKVSNTRIHIRYDCFNRKLTYSRSKPSTPSSIYTSPNCSQLPIAKSRLRRIQPLTRKHARS